MVGERLGLVLSCLLLPACLPTLFLWDRQSAGTGTGVGAAWQEVPMGKGLDSGVLPASGRPSRGRILPLLHGFSRSRIRPLRCNTQDGAMGNIRGEQEQCGAEQGREVGKAKRWRMLCRRQVQSQGRHGSGVAWD